MLFRAGRLEEALKRFERAPQATQPRARDLLFLAMIHAGLGHPNDARRCLHQADRWIADADRAASGAEKEGPSWSDLTEKPITRILRSEAEAVILNDPILPTHPFASE